MNTEWGDGRNFIIADRVRARIKVRLERAGDGPWRRCITTTAKEPLMIPDEAVEAAAVALYERDKALTPFGGPAELPDIRAYMDEARAALEAAAPHLTRAAKAEAWDEGYLAMVDDAFRDRELVKKGSRLADDAASSNPYKKDEAPK